MKSLLSPRLIDLSDEDYVRCSIKLGLSLTRFLPVFAAHVLLFVCFMVERPTQAASLVFSHAFGTGGSGTGQFASPNDVAFDATGNILTTESDNHRVQKFDLAGNFLSTFGSPGSNDGQFIYPYGIDLLASGDVVVSEIGEPSHNHRVQVLTAAGAFIHKFGSLGAANGQFNDPHGMAIDSNDRIIVGDADNNRVQIFDSNGNFVSTFGSAGSGNGQFNGVFALDVDSADRIFVADIGNFRVQVFDSSGNFLYSFGSMGNGDGQFGDGPPSSPIGPRGLAIDAAGHVFVSDTINNRIQVFDTSGNYLTQYEGSGLGQLAFPHGVAVDSLGNVVVADRSNHRFVVLNFLNSESSVVPEPSTFILSAVGLLSLGFIAWRRRRRA